MSTLCTSFEHLSDHDLLGEVTRLAADERAATARLIASLAAFDARRLYLTEGFPSLFAYCTTVLRLSESAAYDRITTARAAQRFPVILEHLAAGSLTLTTVRLLAPHLTDANHVALLADAEHRSKRDVEHLLARLHPQPDVPAAVRKLPAAAPPRQSTDPPVPTRPQPNPSPQPVAPASDACPVAPPPPTPPPRPTVSTPLAPARYKISFTVGAETYAKLRQVQDLLRHAVPDGDPAVIYDRALTVLLTQLLKPKRAVPARPTRHAAASAAPPVSGDTPPRIDVASKSRWIPVAVQRAVWERDGGRCTFVSRNGRRCAARAWLEFHHTVPFAVGGKASVDNVRLLCRAHNQLQAVRDFGWTGPRQVRERTPAYGTNHAELVPARVHTNLPRASHTPRRAPPSARWPQ